MRSDGEQELNGKRSVLPAPGGVVNFCRRRQHTRNTPTLILNRKPADTESHHSSGDLTPASSFETIGKDLDEPEFEQELSFDMLFEPEECGLCAVLDAENLPLPTLHEVHSIETTGIRRSRRCYNLLSWGGGTHIRQVSEAINIPCALSPTDNRLLLGGKHSELPPEPAWDPFVSPTKLGKVTDMLQVKGCAATQGALPTAEAKTLDISSNRVEKLGGFVAPKAFEFPYRSRKQCLGSAASSKRR